MEEKGAVAPEIEQGVEQFKIVIATVVFLLSRPQGEISLFISFFQRFLASLEMTDWVLGMIGLFVP